MSMDPRHLFPKLDQRTHIHLGPVYLGAVELDALCQPLQPENPEHPVNRQVLMHPAAPLPEVPMQDQDAMLTLPVATDLSTYKTGALPPGPKQRLTAPRRDAQAEKKKRQRAKAARKKNRR